MRVLRGGVSRLGPSGAILEPLVAVWGPLGAVAWESVGTTCLYIYIYIYTHDFCFGPLVDRFGGPLWVPKGASHRAKNGSQSKTNMHITCEGFQVPLGCVLGPSWVVLGSILGSTIIKLRWSYTGSVNVGFLIQIRLGSASGKDLGSIWVPKGMPKGSKSDSTRS